MYHVCAQLIEVASMRTLTSVQVASTLKNENFSELTIYFEGDGSVLFRGKEEGVSRAAM